MSKPKTTSLGYRTVAQILRDAIAPDSDAPLTGEGLTVVKQIAQRVAAAYASRNDDFNHDLFMEEAGLAPRGSAVRRPGRPRKMVA